MKYKYLINTGNFGALDEVYEIRILLCYLLQNTPQKLTQDQLVEVATKDDMINYFYLADAIGGMLRGGFAIREKGEDGNEYYSLTEKGEAIAVEFRSYIPRALRDRIVKSATELFEQIKRDREVKCTITELENGFEVSFILLSEKSTLLDIKLYAPDYEQAKKIKRNIMHDPTSFYLDLIGIVLDNND